MTSTNTAYWVRIAGQADDLDIRGYELFSAHRALALLKAKLGRERILELLQDELAAGDVHYRSAVETSAGAQETGTITLHAHGITAAQFGGWLASAFDREDVMLAGHPEHFVIHKERPGRVLIVETLGEQVVAFFMGGWDESKDAAIPAGNARRSRLALGDGTVVGWVSTAFTDVEDGFKACLSVGLPAACGRAVIEQHLQHFSVEFHNWILTAASELGLGK